MCDFILTQGRRKGEKCKNTPYKKGLCSRHFQAHNNLKGTEIIPFSSPAFFEYDFIIFLTSGFLSLSENINMNNVNKKLKRWYTDTLYWKKKCIKEGFLSPESENDGYLECLYLNHIQENKRDMIYKTTASKTYMIEDADMKDFLEPVYNKNYGKICYLIPTSIAFKISSIKHDGIINIKNLFYKKKHETNIRSEKRDIERERLTDILTRKIRNMDDIAQYILHKEISTIEKYIHLQRKKYLKHYTNCLDSCYNRYIKVSRCFDIARNNFLFNTDRLKRFVIDNSDSERRVLEDFSDQEKRYEDVKEYISSENIHDIQAIIHGKNLKIKYEKNIQPRPSLKRSLVSFKFSDEIEDDF